MSVPSLAVDARLETPPYQQIVEQLRGAIERGDLAPGQALPTVRQLSGDLGVAPNTVARAYAELQEAGYILGDGRRGTRVVSEVPLTTKRERARTLREAAAAFVSSLTHRGFSPAEIAEELRRLS